jgi:predicted Rossmann-fold nucleotide-binding protein
LGTLDELFEALTLVQTGKIRRFPVILYGTKYWSGLID